MAGTRFVYRLEKLLELKAGEKERAQQALAARQREMEDQRRLLEDCRRSREAAARKVVDARQELFGTGRPVAAHAMVMRRDYIRRVEAELAAATDSLLVQENSVEEAGERIEDARRVLAGASRDVEVLERHRQRLEARFLRELERKEEVEHDEAGNMMYLRRRQQA